MRLFKSIFCLALLVVIVYSGVQLGSPYFRYYSFKAKIEDISRFELDRDKVMNEIMAVVNEMNIPVKEEEIVLEGMKGRYAIEISWSEKVNLFDIYEREYDFYLTVGR